MNSIVTDDFMDCFARLPAEVREQARRAYRLWRANPSHPGLRFKPIHGHAGPESGFFADRGTLRYNARMEKTASRRRRKPGIGPRGLFFLLVAGIVVFLAGSRIWPSLSDDVRDAIGAIALVAFWALFCMNVIVFFNVWRRG